jgi:hypothetical protein
MGNFDKIEKHLEVKKPKLSFQYLAQLCIEKKKYTLAQELGMVVYEGVYRINTKYGCNLEYEGNISLKLGVYIIF